MANVSKCVSKFLLNQLKLSLKIVLICIENYYDYYWLVIDNDTIICSRLEVLWFICVHGL